VLRVWDGNTVLIEGGYTVRYIGVNTPGGGMFRRPVEAFGREAAERNVELVEGKEVELEADDVDVDASGYMLRYVYVGGTMVNELLLREGLARLAPFGRNTRHTPQLVAAEVESRNERVNIWTIVTPTPTPSNTPTITPTPSNTPTPSITPTPSMTYTPSLTPSPTNTPTQTATLHPSVTLTVTPPRPTPNLTPAVPFTLLPVPPQVVEAPTATPSPQ
jgi:hypothetical protein